jgi:hypothetical protein
MYGLKPVPFDSGRTSGIKPVLFDSGKTDGKKPVPSRDDDVAFTGTGVVGLPERFRGTISGVDR